MIGLTPTVTQEIGKSSDVENKKWQSDKQATAFLDSENLIRC